MPDHDSHTHRIPHNISNTGRVFNLFERKNFRNALLYGIPSCFVIFNLPLTLEAKAFLLVLIVAPPVFAALFGLDRWLVSFLRFVFKGKRVLYRKRKEATDEHRSVFEEHQGQSARHHKADPQDD